AVFDVGGEVRSHSAVYVEVVLCRLPGYCATGRVIPPATSDVEVRDRSRLRELKRRVHHPRRGLLGEGRRNVDCAVPDVVFLTAADVKVFGGGACVDSDADAATDPVATVARRDRVRLDAHAPVGA